MRRIALAVTAMFLAVLALDAEAAAKRKVTLWSFAPNNLREYQARKAEIEAKFGIELDLQIVAQTAFVQKLQAVMMDGTGVPDIVEWMIENARIPNAEPRRSFLLPLDAFAARSSILGEVLPARLAWVRYGGHLYGLPHDVHPVVLVYNDTLWRSVGVDLAQIQTWDEFFLAAKRLTQERRGGKPAHYALPYGGDGLQNTMFMIWQQSGAQIVDERGAPTLTSAEFAAFVSKWLDWQKMGVFVAWDWGSFPALLANGTLASYVSPDWWLPQVNLAATGSADGAATALSPGAAIGRADVKYRFRVRALPLYRRGGPRAASWGGTFMGIPKGTKDAESIYRIIEYIQYDPGAMKIRWEKTGILPPLASLWTDPIFRKGDARLGGQRLGELMVAAAQGIPPVRFGDVFWDAINDFSAQYMEMAAGKISVDQGLKEAQRRSQSRYDQARR